MSAESRNAAEPEKWRLLLAYLAFLYFLQGSMAGFCGIYLIGQLRLRGLDQSSVASLLAAGGLASSLKPLWTILFAPVLDRASRGRGSALALILLPALLGLFVLASPWLLPRVHLSPALVFGVYVLIAVLDLATDGVAVRTVPDRSKDLCNGLMWSANYLGSILGGALLTWLAAHGHGTAGAGLLGCLLVLSGAVRRHAAAGAADPRPSIASNAWTRLGANAAQLWHELNRKGWGLFALCLAATAPTAVAGNLLMERFVHTGALSPHAYALTKGGASALAGALGALVAGLVAARSRSSRLLFGAAVLQTLVWLACLLLPLHTAGATLLVATDDFLQSAWSTFLLGFLMRRAAGPYGATMFGLLMAALNFSGVIGEGIFVGTRGFLSPLGGLGLAAGLQGLFLAVAAQASWRRTDPEPARGASVLPEAAC